MGILRNFNSNSHGPGLIKWSGIILLVAIESAFGQTRLGTVIPNTNSALPDSYNFLEYVFPEPNDQGVCSGANNDSAELQDIFFAQTHRHNIDHPFHFLIGFRPALFQVAVGGGGQAPDVSVEGFMNGESLGVLCLNGPSTLPDSVDLSVPNFEDYFSVTLPKAWIQPGLSLTLNVGNKVQELSGERLKVGPYTEMNLVMVELDLLDYNTQAHYTPIIENFLQETASAFPFSVIRYGTFPERIPFPEIVASNDTEQLVRLQSRQEMFDNGIFSDGYINSVALNFVAPIQQATGDYLSTIYFGNTLNLAPGGWGGDRNFVSFDFDDVYVHELGHALSLPHWGEGPYQNSAPEPWEFRYPYGGEFNDGGGRGESWNFIQDIYEFVDPICQLVGRGIVGNETSDAMQRNNHCLESRSDSSGPWDGFGDFSTLAMHHFQIGGDVTAGEVWYRGAVSNYQLPEQDGFPVVSLENGERIYTRDPLQPIEPHTDERVRVPGTELLNQEVYLVYGTAHPTQDQANIVYAPVKFNGTLSPLIDPTDPATMEAVKTEDIYVDLLLDPRDITLKLTYADDSVMHAVVHWGSYARQDEYPDDYFNIWRYDLYNFALVVPGDKELISVEAYDRPFVSSYWDRIGNVRDPEQNITAENFMDSAKLLASYNVDAEKQIGSNSIGNRVWYDLNGNGLDDAGEPGVAGITLLLLEDTNNDGIPDDLAAEGFTTTDTNGYYLYGGLTPGNYAVAIAAFANWDAGQPLHGMTYTGNQVGDPNNDVNGDNNACFTNVFNLEPGASACDTNPENIDYSSGIITVTADGEPLLDGDREDSHFDYDPSGNMTIDFGLTYGDNRAFYTGGVLVIPSARVDGVTYYVEMELQDLATGQFKLRSAQVVSSNETGTAVFANNKLTVPSVTVSGTDYQLELTLEDAEALTFTVTSYQ